MQGYRHSKFLRINSADRSANSNSRYNIRLNTNDNDLSQVKRVELKSAVIPNTYYNINSFNNTFEFVNATNSPTTTYTVPVGQYTITTLIAELESQVTGLTITQSALTQKLTFTMAAGTYTLDSDVTVNTIARALGIITTQSGVSGATTVTGHPDLTGLTNIYLSSDKLASGGNSMVGVSESYKPVFCTIPIDVDFGVNQVHEEFSSDTMDYVQFSAHRSIANVDIQLLDSDLNEVDLNGVDWEVILRVYM